MSTPVNPDGTTSENVDAPKTAGTQSRARTLFGIGSGNAMEWFDWNIYATFAPFFASQFFNSKDPVSDVLSTLAVFAVGFLARRSYKCQAAFWVCLLGGFCRAWNISRVMKRLRQRVISLGFLPSAVRLAR